VIPQRIAGGRWEGMGLYLMVYSPVCV
jgi:hypothetical protein